MKAVVLLGLVAACGAPPAPPLVAPPHNAIAATAARAPVDIRSLATPGAVARLPRAAWLDHTARPRFRQSDPPPR